MSPNEVLNALITFLSSRLARAIRPESDLVSMVTADQIETLVDDINLFSAFGERRMSITTENAIALRRVDKVAFELWHSGLRHLGDGARNAAIEQWKAEVKLGNSLRAPQLPGNSVASRGNTEDRPTLPRTATGVPAGVAYQVWYGTNRKPNDEDNISLGFSGERGIRVHLGSCTVHVPKSHKIGSVGSSWCRRLLAGVDDRLKLAGVEELPPDAFWASISTRLKELEPDEREAVIFVHGYNVSFSDAAVRAAQLGTDLAIRGGMAFFSWPSKGSTESYIRDEASIEASESAITQFLVDFAGKSEASRVHVIAHSMGNRGVLRAINRIAASATERTGKPFDQIILAAPDVDADVFRDLCAAYSQVARRTTLYVSAKDLAVEAARWLHGFPRAGLLPPVMVSPGIDTVNVTHADLTMLGHGYVAEARLVLTDMHALLRFGASPRDRAGLQIQTSDNGQTYWLIGQ